MITFILYGIITVLIICLVWSLIRARKQILADEVQAEKNNRLKTEGWVLQQQNEELQHEKEKTENYLSGIKTAVQAQENILKSLSATAEEMRVSAKKRADEEYQIRFDALAADYAQKENDYKCKYEQAITILNKNLLAEKGKLEDLEAKQRAYFEAQKRAQEIEEQKDFYRLALSDYDRSDIQLLRQLQAKFVRKDVIDKMIWETYYRPAFDTLAGRIFPAEKVCGIYKITSLITQQAYIGQSVDVKERFRQHIKNGLSYATATNKLYQEMYKQGPENFTFEILEKIPREKLNDRETYWIDFYKTKEIGLNITRGGA